MKERVRVRERESERERVRETEKENKWLRFNSLLNQVLTLVPVSVYH